jgi:uncharacterized membrane protein YcaP (DUF421 family)
MYQLLSDITGIAVKSLVAAVVLFSLARIMGKKQISQLTYFDYVVGISIGSIAAMLSLDRSISYVDGISSMIIWAAFPLVLSLIASRSMRGRRLLDGTPTILIQDGKIIEKNLSKAKFTINDLLEELRIKDAFNIADVEFALLETSGKVSVLKKSPNQPVTKSDLEIPSNYQGLCANVIIDGKIMTQNLSFLKINETWLLNEIEKNNIHTVKDVLLASYDTNGVLHIDMKSHDPQAFDVLQ